MLVHHFQGKSGAVRDAVEYPFLYSKRFPNVVDIGCIFGGVVGGKINSLCYQRASAGDHLVSHELVKADLSIDA